MGLVPISDEDELKEVLERFMLNVHTCFRDDEKYSILTVSMGASVVNGEDTYYEVFNRADNALRYVKRNGKNRYHIYHYGDVVQAPIVGR